MLAAIAEVAFADFEMRGVVARRRVAFFGGTYSSDAPAQAIPDFLRPLRDRIGAWSGQPPQAFSMALINEYRVGAPIGWHRDARQYDIVAGVSLLSACTMRFRPYVPASPSAGPRRATHAVELEPRSVYLLTGDARSQFEHHIPAATRPRYSITFRTLR